MYIFKKSLNKSNIVETIESIENLKSIPEEIKSTFLDVLYEAQEEIIEDNETEITVNIKVEEDAHSDKDTDSDEIIDIEDIVNDEDKESMFGIIFNMSLDDVFESDIFSEKTKELIVIDIFNSLHSYELFSNTDKISINK